MKNIFSFLIMLILMGSNLELSAQKMLDKGSVRMEVTNISAEDPQMAMRLEMMSAARRNTSGIDDFPSEEIADYSNAG